MRRRSTLARAIAERAGDDAPAGGLGRRDEARRGVPAGVPATGRRPRQPARPRPSIGRPTGAASSTSSTATPGSRSTTCGGRGSPGHGRAAARRPTGGPDRVRRCGREGRPTGSCRGRSATHAGLAVRRGDRAASRRDGRPRQPGVDRGRCGEAGLTVPATLRTAFERPAASAPRTQEATAEQAAIDRLRRCGRRHAIAVPGRVPDVGSVGRDAGSDLGQARDAFAAGDLARSVDAAGAASAAWASAAELGRGRAVSIGAGALAILLALGMLVVLARSWRRRRAPGRWLVGAAGDGPAAGVAWSPGDDAASGSSLSATSTAAAPADRGRYRRSAAWVADRAW